MRMLTRLDFRLTKRGRGKPLAPLAAPWATAWPATPDKPRDNAMQTIETTLRMPISVSRLLQTG